MDIRKISDYSFYTTREFDNPLHDRRHKRGIHSKATIPSGTQVRVEVTSAFASDGQRCGQEVKTYYISGHPVTRLMGEVLKGMDPGHDDQPRTISDLASRNFCSAEWFSLSVLEQMVEDGKVTLDQIQQAWESIEEDPAC
jgi:hypothetical protein